MLESLKSLWARWKVQVSFVGGALVVATAYGTCSYDPQEVSEEPAAEVEAAAEETTMDVSNTTANEDSTPETETTNTISEEPTNTGE
jgi:hypothetical protein